MQINELRRFAPRARQGILEEIINQADGLAAAGVSTPIRVCHWLAQVATETGDLTAARESLRYDRRGLVTHFKRYRDNPAIAALHAGREEIIAEYVYGQRDGNTEPGDGWAFRGGGGLMTTFRPGYRRMGDLVGYDLERNPEMIEEPELWVATAIAEWRERRCNVYADRGNLLAVRRAINTSSPTSSVHPWGMDRAEQLLHRAWGIWGDGHSMPAPDGVSLGDESEDVAALQRRLGELGHPVGVIDGRYGQRTAQAVAAFKARWRRETGGEIEAGDEIGPLTRSALREASPLDLGERAVATSGAVSLVVPEVRHGRAQTLLGPAVGLAAVVKGSDDLGGVDELRRFASDLPEWQRLLVPAVDALQWGVKHILWVGLVVLACLVWRSGSRVVQLAVDAYRRGIHLGSD